MPDHRFVYLPLQTKYQLFFNLTLFNYLSGFFSNVYANSPLFVTYKRKYSCCFIKFRILFMHIHFHRIPSRNLRLYALFIKLIDITSTQTCKNQANHKNSPEVRYWRFHENLQSNKRINKEWKWFYLRELSFLQDWLWSLKSSYIENWIDF